MGTHMLWMLLLAPFGAICAICAETQTDNNTNDRLANIEAVLKTVLAKNSELESRIEVLEEENQRLKATAIIQDQPIRSDGDKTARETHSGDEGNDDADSQVTVKNVIRRNNEKVPRSVLSVEDTIAFTAVISPHSITKLGIAQTIKYDKVITNVGGGYHNHTGVFIAPIGGVYVFTFDTMTEPGDHEELGIMHDGHFIAPTLNHGSGETRFITTSRTLVLRLNQGSEVWIQTRYGEGVVHGNGYSSFSGWLIGYGV